MTDTFTITPNISIDPEVEALDLVLSLGPDSESIAKALSLGPDLDTESIALALGLDRDADFEDIYQEIGFVSAPGFDINLDRAAINLVLNRAIDLGPGNSPTDLASGLGFGISPGGLASVIGPDSTLNDLATALGIDPELALSLGLNPELALALGLIPELPSIIGSNLDPDVREYLSGAISVSLALSLILALAKRRLDLDRGGNQDVGGFFNQISYETDDKSRKLLYVDDDFHRREKEFETAPLAIGDKIKIDGESEWRTVTSLPDVVVSKEGRIGRSLSGQYYGSIGLTNNLQKRSGSGLVVHAKVNRKGEISNVSFLRKDYGDLAEKSAYGYFTPPELEIIPQDGESGGGNLAVITNDGRVIGIKRNWPGEYKTPPILVESRGYSIRKERDIGVRISTQIEDTTISDYDNGIDPIILLPDDGYDTDIDRYFERFLLPDRYMGFDLFVKRILRFEFDFPVDVDTRILTREELVQEFFDYFNSPNVYNLVHWIDKFKNHKYSIDLEEPKINYELFSFADRYYGISLPRQNLGDDIQFILTNEFDYSNENKIDRFISLDLKHNLEVGTPSLSIQRYTYKYFNYFFDAIKNNIFDRIVPIVLNNFVHNIETFLEHIIITINNTNYFIGPSTPDLDIDTNIIRDSLDQEISINLDILKILERLSINTFISFTNFIKFNEDKETQKISSIRNIFDISKLVANDIDVEIFGRSDVHYEVGDVSTKLNLLLEYRSELIYPLDRTDSTVLYLSSSANNYPRENGVIRIGTEEIKYSRRIGTRFFIESRGFNGTTPQNWEEGTFAYIFDIPPTLFYSFLFDLDISGSFDIIDLSNVEPKGEEQQTYTFGIDQSGADIDIRAEEEYLLAIDLSYISIIGQVHRDIFDNYEVDYSNEIDSIEDTVLTYITTLLDSISIDTQFDVTDEIVSIDHERRYDDLYATFENEYRSFNFGDAPIRNIGEYATQGTRLQVSLPVTSRLMAATGIFPPPTKDNGFTIVIVGDEPFYVNVSYNQAFAEITALSFELLLFYGIIRVGLLRLLSLMRRTSLPKPRKFWPAGTFVEYFVESNLYSEFGEAAAGFPGTIINMERGEYRGESILSTIPSIPGYYEISEDVMPDNTKDYNIHVWAGSPGGFTISSEEQVLDKTTSPANDVDERTEDMDDWYDIDSDAWHWATTDYSKKISKSLGSMIRVKFNPESRQRDILFITWQTWV